MSASFGEHEDRPEDMPCGSCAAGVYHEKAILKGLEMFGHCSTRKQALAEAPRCKRDSSHICFGARDWIIPADFPITDDRRAEMLRICGISSTPSIHGELQ
jgi:hypothetical protein